MKQPERITNTHIYFWGSFYSQWAKYTFYDKNLGLSFTSCEQFMMYNKAKLFEDMDSATKILATNNVKKQKDLGRKVKKFDIEKWNDKKFNIIVKGNYLKFSQNKELKQELLSTANKIIVEASPYDKIYGVGLKWDDDLILDEKNWNGENLLGKAIMTVRTIIRKDNKDNFNDGDFLEHEWISYKDDDFRSCKNCGIIENIKNTKSHCRGKVKITLRASSRDFNKIEKEIKNPETNNKLSKALKKIDDMPSNWFDWSPLYMEIEGSILEAKEDIIAQGCNCAGASGAGIAKYIGKEYPNADKKYKDLCREKKFKLGSVMFYKEKNKIQAFCGTQEFYGKFLKMDKESIENRYKAIEISLIKIYNKAKKENLSVALPRIGCGRARSDWSRVKKIIQKIFHDYPVTIYWIPDRYSQK